MEYKCPECGSVVYSRKNVLCAVCGQRLPDELLFTPAEREAVEQEMKELKHREQLARAKEEKEAEERARDDSVAKRVGKRHPVLGALINIFTRSE